MDIVAEVKYSEWEFWEQHYISLFKSFGFNLTNHLKGHRKSYMGYRWEYKNK